MTSPVSLLERAVELDRSGSPYALATVVAVRRPTSARPGARGLIHPDGTIEGFVGGSCARPIVVREALRALADGQPRLLRISKEAPSESRRGDGIVDEVMTCHSGGTLEIYVEPHLPAPALWVAGTTPIAASLAELGAVDGLRRDAHRSGRRPERPAGRAPGRRRRRPRGSPQAGRRAVRRRRQPGRLGRGGLASALRLRRRLRRARRQPDPGRGRPDLAARRGDRARPGPRDAGAGGPRPRGRDGRRGRRLDPGRARPGPPRPGAVRRRARAGDAGRRGAGR